MNSDLIRAGQGSSQTPTELRRGHLGIHSEMATITGVRSLKRFSPFAHLRHSCCVFHESFEFFLAVFTVP